MAAPFSGKDNNPFLDYGVETEYLPPEPTYELQDDIVPAVPEPIRFHQPQHQAVPPLVPAPVHQPLVNQPPRPEPPPQQLLHFTETTTSTHVTGTISSTQQQNTGNFATLPASTPAGFSADFAENQPAKKYAFYNPRYYRAFFDVNTEDVLWRISNSALGPFKSNFIDHTGENPDLYGPFWVATTLVFVAAVSGWLAKLNANNGKKEKHSMVNQAKEISISAAIFYGYIFVIGLALYALVRWFKGNVKLATVWCIYGYSLSIFIPVILLCTLPYDPLRWALILGPAVSSALFLVRNFKATVTEATPASAFVVLLVMFSLHVGLGLTIKLYFFGV